MRGTFTRLLLSAVSLVLGLGPAAVAGAEPEAEVAAAPPVYQLPKVGKPTGRVGGGRRGIGDLPAVYALVPDHVGYTTSAQPVLYWYLSERARGDVRFELTLIDEASVDPLLDQRFSAPSRPGLQAIRLADHGVKLAAGEEYQWSVSLVPEPGDRSKDVVSSGWIELVAEPDGLARKLAAAGAQGQAGVYGEAGLWYDTLDASAARVQADPDDAGARAALAGLLSQVGLTEAAAKP